MRTRKDLNCTSYMDAISEAGLNFKVELAPITALIREQQLEVKNHYAPFRTDTGMPLDSVVGSRYNIIQTYDMADVADSIVKPLNATYVNGGLLRNKFFVQAKMPDSFKIGNKDLVDKMLTFLGSFDGTTPQTAGFSNVRVICENTYRMAMKDCLSYVCIRHTASAEDKIKQSEHILKAALDYQAKVELKCSQFALTSISDVQVETAIQKAFGVNPNSEANTRTIHNMEKVRGLFESGKGIADIPEVRGTAWALFNAFTEYSDHGRTVKHEDNDPFARFESNLIGSSSQFKDRAFEIVNSLV